MVCSFEVCRLIFTMHSLSLYVPRASFALYVPHASFAVTKHHVPHLLSLYVTHASFAISLHATCLNLLSMYHMPRLLTVRTTCFICCLSTYHKPHLLSMYHMPHLLTLYVPHAHLLSLYVPHAPFAISLHATCLICCLCTCLICCLCTTCLASPCIRFPPTYLLNNKCLVMFS